MFGETRLLALLDCDRKSSVAAALDRVESALALHVGQTPRFDDITLLAVRRE
jgi:serine phosphatase RsbU (regulator of sigma subunit)